MRLGQTARLLKVNPADIVEALKAEFREVNNHPNVKITYEELTFLKSKFEFVEESEASAEAPEQAIAEPVAEAPVETEVEEAAPEPIATEAEATPKFVESLRPKVITLEKEFDERKENLDSFKAEKPQLEGLKVLGKIDIPEPVKKEPKPENEQKEERPKRNGQRRNQRGGKRNDRRNRNLTPAEERERAERIALRKKVEEEKRQKELKRKHYEENVAAKVAKPKRKKKKKLVLQHQQEEQRQQNGQSKPQRSSNPIARFWKWLNGGYDSFD